MSSNAIPGYILKRKLGAGAMASVYLAQDEKLHRDVALKVMSKKLLAAPSFVDRFLREARIVASISHRNIVTVFDVGSHNNYHYMAMEFLPGGDLSSKMKKGLSLEQAVSHVIDIADGLQYASSRNFIHRDIKPDNIMFAEDGRAVITDFGIARDASAETNMTVAGTVIGTPQYMSPEQAGGKELDHRSDLYSLGIILYEMLVGRTPFKGDSAISTGIMHISEPVPPLPEKYSPFQNVIDIALAKNPDDRFQSGKDFIRALSRVSLEMFDEDVDATVVLSPGRSGKGQSTSGLQSASDESSDLLSDLSDEFLTTEATSIVPSANQAASDLNNDKQLDSSLASSATEDSSSETQNLTLIESDDSKVPDTPKKQKKTLSFKVPLPSKKILLLLFLFFAGIGGHIYYLNVLGKQIHFDSLATKATKLTDELTGTSLNFYGIARVLSIASNGIGRLSAVLLEDVLPENQALLNLSGAEKQYLKLMDVAMAEGRLYAPRFDCAEIYFMELSRINPDSKIVTKKANELMKLSIERAQGLSSTNEINQAKAIVVASKRILPFVENEVLKQRHRQITRSLNL